MTISIGRQKKAGRIYAIALWLASIGIAALVTLSGCSSDNATQDAGTDGLSDGSTDDGGGHDGDESPTPAWQRLGEVGGFVSAVAFDPGGMGVWLSGDDGSGLYLRHGDGPWDLLTEAPLNWSTFSWAFDPNNPETVFAPNFYGRGLAVTHDSGESFDLIESLPFCQAVYDFEAIPAEGGTRLVAATAAGLFLSDDLGQTFTKRQLPTEMSLECTALAWRQAESGELVVGTEKGGLFLSLDQGDTFTAILEPYEEGVSVSDLAFTTNALYIGFVLGVLFRNEGLSSDDFSLIYQEDPPSSYSTQVATSSGTDATQDRVYMGTVIGPDSPARFLVSDNGGDTFTDKSDNLAEATVSEIGASVFDIAVDPQDPDHLIFTTRNDGVFESHDAGESFQNVSDGVFATDSLGFAEDTENPDHIVYSSQTGGPGVGRVHESMDRGQTFQLLDQLSPFIVLGMHLRENRLLVGTVFNGIWRREENEAFLQVVNPMTRGFGQIVASQTKPDLLYGITEEMLLSRPPGDPFSDAGIWVSNDDGKTWAQSPNSLALCLATWPGRESGVAYGSDDVYLTDDVFSTTAHPIGLAVPLDPGDLVTALTFVDENTILLGTASSRVFLASNCIVDTGCDIEELQSPSNLAPIFGVAVISSSTGPVWLISAWIGDFAFQEQSVAGVWASTDRGDTWYLLQDGLYPADMIFGLFPSVVPGRVYAGMWGGGLMRMELPPQ
ncbi:MAG: hypothetical protein JRF33_10430 [Deltaproteobacteria bacterium]|nr:hypothetical protein [Deltaproteobacteria bacterium]